MGFDVHGIKPKINKELDDTTIYGMVESIQDYKERWEIQEKFSEEDKKDYWKQYEEHHENNPGVYFRNNVWWWRPLWDFVCSYCDDILNEKDIEAGNYNDGKKISKNKAEKIAKRLFELIKTGVVDEYEAKHEEEREEKEKSKDRNVQFFANYPFEKENVERFAIFCQESGGFEIC